MNKITWIDPYLDLVLNEIPIDSKSILEVGCGSGIFGFILKKTRGARIVGVEPFAYELNYYDYVYQMTWKKFFRIGESFDVLICNETIEHMEKEDALSFLDEVKTVAKKVIITTPYKFEQQPAYDDNPFQIHKSVLSINDFKNKGYNVSIIGTQSKKGISCRCLYNSKLTVLGKIFGVKPTNIMGVWKE